MYMCRETIRRAVVQKFNDLKGWNCQNLEELYDKIEDKKEANNIINSLKICDPGVGSGHFLVSSLNEIIAIKSELKILSDKQGKRLKEYHVEVANDELIVTDEDGELFEYNPKSPESQRVQEAIFHEKQTIIENCLFGVDINPNSVKICRLRLWIELLKNSYYKAESNYTELETLPNIDINIKCGNSLISRYAMDADIKQALKKSKWSIESYRLAVSMYRNATSKEQKREMERLIASIKTDFETEVAANDKRLLQLKKLNGDLFNLTQQTSLFERTRKELADWNKQVNDLTGKIKKLENELEEIKINKIYENAFEWRLEFPEVLNDEGEFVGFDVVIGNPPYLLMSDKDKTGDISFYEERYVTQYKIDLYHLFLQKGLEIISVGRTLSFITPSTWLTQKFTEKLRKYIIENDTIEKIILLKNNIFEEADVTTGITFITKLNNEDHPIKICQVIDDFIDFHFVDLPISEINASNLYSIDLRGTGDIGILVRRLKNENPRLDTVARASLGCQAYNNSKHSIEEITNRVFHAEEKKSDEYLPELAGNDVGRYYYQWKKGKWIKYGPWLHDFRSIDWLEGPRILIREIAGPDPYKIQATYIEETYCNYKTILHVNPIQGSDLSMKYLCGLLNSNLLSFLFTYTSNKMEAKSFPRISVGDLRQLPIKLINSDNPIDSNNGVQIENLVDQITSLKRNDPSANTETLETIIDHLVYELYGLTAEEVKIIEGKLKK